MGSNYKSKIGQTKAIKLYRKRWAKSWLKASAAPELTGVFSSYKINVPQLYVELDRTKAKQLGLNINEVFEAMQIYLGSLYINDFNKFGRTYQVIAQAEKQFRDAPNDMLNLKVRNQRGEMVPLGCRLTNQRNLWTGICPTL